MDVASATGVAIRSLNAGAGSIPIAGTGAGEGVGAAGAAGSGVGATGAASCAGSCSKPFAFA